MKQYFKKMNKFYVKHPDMNSFVHVVVGMGFGFLLTYPLAGSHPVRWGLTFLIAGLIGHIWAATH